MLAMIYDYIESTLKNGEDFQAIENGENIEKQVITKSTISVTYSYINKQGCEEIKTVDVNVFEVMSFVYKKVAKLVSKAEEEHYDQR